MPHVCFILHPRFQMLAYVFACETLRIANRRAGRKLFTWETRSATSAPVHASNGQAVHPDVSGWGASVAAELVLVMAGYDPLSVRPAGLGAFLQRQARAGAMLGGIDTGVAILASFDLLRGCKVVLHHEAEPGFRETWPDVDVADAIYHLDRTRLSSAGGTATGDAMLAWVADRVSPAFSAGVATDLVHGTLRPATESQRMPDMTDPVVRSMRDLMLRHLEAPIPISEIALQVGVSMKTLRARCQRALRQTPSALYLSMRLDHARALLVTTTLSIAEIAVATGFGSHAGFSRTYRNRWRESPKDTRAAGM